MSTRRNVLQFLATAPLATSCMQGALPDPIEAWRDPGAGETDPRRYALAHAILAPNPHNRQPWQVTTRAGDELMLFVDLDRRLPETDPLDRQIVLGCGAFLELFDLAARNAGLRATINPWPEGEPQPRLDRRPVAHVRLAQGETAKDALFDQILQRRTSREPFLERTVETATLQEIVDDASPGEGLSIGWSNGGALRDQLRQLAWDGHVKEYQTPHAHQETARLARIGRVALAHERDGISIQGPFVEIAQTLGLFNNRVFADVNNPITKQGLDAWRPLALDAPAFMWIRSADNSRATQVAAGRAYARLNLAATARGLAMHPWSQTLQEYPEMAALHAKAEELMDAPDDARVQMFVRVGYPEKVSGPAARRGLDSLFTRTAPSSQPA